MPHRLPYIRFVLFFAVFFLALSAVSFAAPCTFDRDFAPGEDFVAAPEQPLRQSICLNGRWQFQPVPLPKEFRRGTGTPPDLPPPTAEGWENVPLKIPSPWNVNTWGCGRATGAGTSHPYWPGSLYYPSYPAAWDTVEMGWTRRSFRVPADWPRQRIVLHFEAVAGECQVLVNGRMAGGHFDKFLPFDIDVTALVRRDAQNELLVGIRNHWLFDKIGRVYPKMNAPYPCGSNTDGLVGIWQDVYLLSLPAVRIRDVFVKPLVDRDTLELEVTLQNDTAAEQSLRLAGDIHPWINLAGHEVLSAPEPKWRLDPPVLNAAAREITLPPGGQTTVTLRETVRSRLQTWTPETPNLYAALLHLSRGATRIDSHYTRFGWRQLAIRGGDLLLNGRKLKLVGDLLHPFGPLSMSRRNVWAWYKMVKDFGGNAVRPHAQIHPRCYLDLADEMGIMVLDETALFGSSIRLNFEEPEAWRRFESHYDGLVLRDRNHPSVFGWSFGNELFAIFNLNQVSREDSDRWYGQLTKLGLRARRLDPTRDWISCDGDEDLRGTLPVWSKHFGHGTPLDRLPQLDKPLMVGESGGTYYARPKELAIFNGDRAYEDYRGRSEALGIDLYDNLVRMARPRLAYFSASETVWFGLEHLNLGYDDFTRLPGDGDGVRLASPFAEGRPGMQPERIPPYVTTLNPGWDPRLPLYRPLPMFHAEKAAMTPGGPQPCPYPAAAAASGPVRPQPMATIDRVAFHGDRHGALARRLTALGVPLSNEPIEATPAGLTIMDLPGPQEADRHAWKQTLDAAAAHGGIILVMLAAGPQGTVPVSSQESVDNSPLAGLLDAPLHLTQRPATGLTADASHPWVASLTLADLYFAEDGADRYILRQGMDGPLVQRGRVLLQASNTDWSLFNESGENAKCASLMLYEHLTKPSGAALVASPHGKGTLLLSTVDWHIATRQADQLWRKLFAALGVKLRAPRQGLVEAFDEEQTLVRAMSMGRFGATDVETALARDFIGEKSPRACQSAIGGRDWKIVESPSKDRFVLRDLRQDGPTGAFAVYFSYWIRSPRGLDDLLAGGPDAPRFSTLVYVAQKCRLFMNGEELKPTRTDQADYRVLDVFDGVPLKKGWNHFLLKVASDHFEGDTPGTVAVRIQSNNADYLRQLESTLRRD